MKYRMVMFDFDGTLADSFPWFSSVLNEVADKYRFRRVGAHEIDLLRSLSGREVMKHIGASSWKMPFIAAHMRRLKARDVASVPLFPGTTEMLRGLHDAGVRLSLVSSNAERNVLHVLGRETASLIEHYECSVSIFGKTSRFRRVLRRAGLRSEEVLCVGDEIRDAEAARAAGIPFGAVTWGYTTTAALLRHEPAEVFDSMSAIVPVVTA